MDDSNTNRISKPVFLFCVACFIQSATMLSVYVVGLTEQDSWAALLFAAVLYLPVLAVLLTLIRKFPDKGLFELNEAAFGKVGGAVVSGVYVLFFYFLTTLNLNSAGRFVKQTIMTNTPIEVLNICYIALAAYAISKGFNVIGRYATFFSFLSLAVISFSIFATSQIFDVRNFLPLFDKEPMRYVQSTHILLTIPLGELVCMLVIAPYVKRNKPGLGKEFLWGYIVGLVAFLAVLIRDAGVLGNTIGYFSLPAFQTLKLARVADTLGHLEILLATVLIVLIYFRIALLFFCMTVMLAKIVRVKNLKFLVISTASMVLTYSFFIFQRSTDRILYNTSVTPFLWTVVEILLPVTTLMVLAVRGKLSHGAAGKG
ncbi:MAG: endospore germination permease [Oscillospiraceae bacterium]